MKQHGLPFTYEAKDEWEVNLAAKPSEAPLDCRGKDSGLSSCWPAAVNISVPIVCCAVFFVVLVVIYVFSKTKPSPNTGSDDSDPSQQRKPAYIRPPAPLPSNICYQNSAVSTDTLASNFGPTMTSQYDSSANGTVSIAVEMDPSLMTKL